VPPIQFDNAGAIVAVQSLVRDLDIGLFYRTIPDLAAQLRDGPRMRRLRDRTWAQREQFCFDTHVPDLTTFFRNVIDATAKRGYALR
jgi:hypothetical protein